MRSGSLKKHLTVGAGALARFMRTCAVLLRGLEPPGTSAPGNPALCLGLREHCTPAPTRLPPHNIILKIKKRFTKGKSVFICVWKDQDAETDSSHESFFRRNREAPLGGACAKLWRSRHPSTESWRTWAVLLSTRCCDQRPTKSVGTPFLRLVVFLAAATLKRIETVLMGSFSLSQS